MSGDKRDSKRKGSKTHSEEEELVERLRSELFGTPGSGTDYEVGYRKPPVATQFKKGFSGNPAGRPKRKHNPRAPQSRSTTPGSATHVIRQELTRNVVVQEAGEPKQMPLSQAAIRQLQQLGFNGSVNAIKELVKLTKEEADKREAEIAEDHAFWIWYCDEFEAKAQRIEKAGGAVPEWWPRPEDIDIRPNEMTLIRGPVSSDELPMYRWLEKLRDAFIAKTKYDTVVFTRADGQDAAPHDIQVIGMLPYLIDLYLPKRMQLSQDGIFDRMMDAVVARRIDLKGELVHAYAELGWKAPLDEPGEPIGHRIYQLGLDPAELRQSLTRSSERYFATGNN